MFSATTTGTTATLYGILWGGGGGTFVFSAWENIDDELGASDRPLMLSAPRVCG